jgi:hypothetical protein
MLKHMDRSALARPLRFALVVDGTRMMELRGRANLLEVIESQVQRVRHVQSCSAGAAAALRAGSQSLLLQMERYPVW